MLPRLLSNPPTVDVLLMLTPEIPANEADRLQALEALCILDTPEEERFERFTRLAQYVFQVPIAVITLVDRHRQWFKSHRGLAATETSRQVSFCGHTILDQAPMIVPNALQDARFADNPLVVGDPNIRFYAGVPLRSRDGYAVGVLCIIDTKPRDFPDSATVALSDLANCVQHELQGVEQVQAARNLARTRIHLHNVLDTVRDGILTVDDRGHITMANQALTRMFGHEESALLDTPLSFLLPSATDTQLPWTDILNEACAVQGDIPLEVWALHATGKRFPVAVSVSAMLLEDKRFHTLTLRDISREKAAAEALYASNNLNQAILDAADFSIISTTIDGVIRTFNRGAQRMLGYHEDEVVGRVTPAIIHDINEVVSRAATLSKELNCAIEPGFEVFVAKAKRGVNEAVEWTYIRKDGSRFPVLLSVSAVRNQNGDVIGFLGVGSDITERRKVDQMKSEFVSTVSHELRTPLTSIRGALGLVAGLHGASLPSQASTLLETASRNAERLTLLINDILDLEKIESGKLDFHFEPLDIARLAAQSVADNEGYAARHQVHLQLTPQTECLTVMGDSHRLLQVFSNLISNAIKFSPPGQTVRVGMEKRNDRVRVQVSDLGRGIPETFRTRVFGRFVQVDSSDSREKGGTGLGLSITKAIVLRHGGDIDFVSAPGEGCTFYFDLPLRETVPVPGEDSGADVLICEDDLDTAQVLRLLLQKAQISSHVAHSASEARQAFANHRYAVALLDMTLADGPSQPLLDEISKDCQVVIFSAENPQLGQHQSKVAAVLTKTQVSDNHLLDTLRRLIKR